jgi:hypothetical protein
MYQTCLHEHWIRANTVLKRDTLRKHNNSLGGEKRVASLLNEPLQAKYSNGPALKRATLSKHSNRLSMMDYI